jgi:hypothetical protein
MHLRFKGLYSDGYGLHAPVEQLHPCATPTFRINGEATRGAGTLLICKSGQPLGHTLPSITIFFKL